MLQYFVYLMENNKFEDMAEKIAELSPFMTEEEKNTLLEKVEIKLNQYKLMKRELTDEL